ncbi:integrase, partial [Planococcus sp. SIMBA_143]
LSLQQQMLDNSRYTQLMDQTEYDPDFDYSAIFNDLEMIYLFVHHERDLDKQKNRTEKTKKEYLRELLFFYNQISAVGDLYNFDST